MKRPMIPLPRKKASFAEKFGRDAAHFGSPTKHEPPRKTYLPRILVCLVGVLVLTVVVALLGLVPKVGEVSATGGRMYDADRLLYYADIQTGDDLLGFDAAQVEEQMKQYMPLLKEAHVRKHINGNVTITTTEYESLYYTCHNRNYYAFTTDAWRVICVMPDESEFRRVGAVYIGLPESARVRVDEKISFVNLPYDSEETSEHTVDYEVETDVPEKENAYVREFVDALMSSPLAPRVNGMELSDRYDVWFVLDGRIRVSVGDMAELADKLDSVQKVLEDYAASGEDTGELPISVDVSDPTRTVVRVSPDVEIPLW